MLETKSIAALAFNETPRKRKRETAYMPPLKNDDDAAVAVTAAAAATTASCFTNAAFSSTPKQLIGRRRLAKDRQNLNPFVGSLPGLEVKSIAALATAPTNQPEKQEKPISTNPFEVVRQPTKKKKREHACFENPALNLELPERQFNPYEVVRCMATPPSKGFVNEALNVRGSDAPASLNPFEIHRRSEISAAASNPAGVENPALLEEPLPTSLKIGLPFAPTIGCRIDFTGMELENLTPSKLLAEKLVFSPVTPVTPMTPMTPMPKFEKRALRAICEESPMDIGKELDRYQLELENSINEAKLRKKGIFIEENELEQQTDEQPERRVVCTMRRRTLTEITEETIEEPQREVGVETEAEQEAEAEAELESEVNIEAEVEAEVESGVGEEILSPVKPVCLLPALESADVAYASESEPESEPEQAEEDEVDFKAPSRFVRSYRPAATVAPQRVNSIAGSKESLQSNGSSKSSKSGELRASHAGHGVRNMIRKSIRRLIHPKQQSTAEEELDEPEEKEKLGNIISSIRHSLRRKPHKSQEFLAQSGPADISIVDSSERTLKLHSSVPQTEYMRIEQLTNERKHTLRNSIRRSTRDVLRHVFHKSQDAYATSK